MSPPRIRHAGRMAFLASAAIATACGFEDIGTRAKLPEYPGRPPQFQCRRLRAAERPPVTPLGLGDLAANWEAAGEAFATDQPISLSSVQALYAISTLELVELGGDYWSDSPYPVARQGAPWVSSAFRQPRSGLTATWVGLEAQGTLTSRNAVVLGPKTRHFQAAIGGTADAALGRVELLVPLQGTTEAALAADGAALAACDREQLDVPRKRVSLPGSTETWFPVYVRTGRGDATLRAVDVSLEPCLPLLAGRTARVRIIDESASAHIGAADLLLGESRLPLASPRVWGLADLHTHPSAHVGFGGLNGIHTVWGGPGGSIDAYRKGNAGDILNHFERDIPQCDDGHHGGLASPIVIAVSERRTSQDPDDLEVPRLATHHGHRGGPGFEDFPEFRSGAHQQHHITQIHRAYLGGLRFMSALALHNEGLEYGMGWATCGGKGRARVDTTGDMAVVRAHVQVMRELAALNSSWMEIAYSPAGARRIVQSNKLAVVLGVEVPQLGLPADGSVADQVEELVGLGIRQVAPIHAMDNALGGPAVYEDFYNSVSDWMNRPADIRDVGLDLAGAFDNEIGPHAFYNLELDPEKTEPILLRLGKPTRIVLSDAFPRPGECESRFFSFAKTGCVHPFISTTPKLQKPVSPYKDLMGGSTGHRNVRGLTGRGQEYVSRLIGRGVLVDVAHMSDRALLDARATIDRACPGHPVMMSHAGFRKLMFRDDYSALGARFVEDTAGVVRANPDMSACVKDSSKCPRSVIEAADRAMKSAKGPGSLNKSFLPKEFDARTSTVDDIRKRGGVLGVFVGQDPIDSRALAPDVALPFANDCAGSSKGFAAALLFARAHLSPEQVAVASDLVMHSNLVPRFGKHACALYAKAGSGSASGLQYLETLLNRAQYRFADQRGAVRYAKGNPTMCAGDARDVRCGNNAPLEPYRMGKRVFDFNVDGFAHVGMLPDLLQDVKNMGVATGPLFSSAEGAIAMWEAAWGAAGCNEAAEVCNPKPTPLDPDRTCRDGCPSSWNGGAPLTLLEEKRRECRPLEEITLRQGKLRYSPREADEGRNTALLSRQGDWAVFEVPEGKPVEWNCGSDAGDAVRCPAGTRFMKVRRVLETRIGADPICDNPPSFPLPGNRRVMFQCLKAPPDLPLPLPAQAAE